MRQLEALNRCSFQFYLVSCHKISFFWLSLPIITLGNHSVRPSSLCLFAIVSRAHATSHHWDSCWSILVTLFIITLIHDSLLGPITQLPMIVMTLGDIDSLVYILDWTLSQVHINVCFGGLFCYILMLTLQRPWITKPLNSSTS